MLVKYRINILDRLQKFIKDDIGFGRKGRRKRFAGFHAPSFECKRVFITNVKGTFFGMSESEEASKRR